MSAAELWGEEAFVRLMKDVIADSEERNEPPVNLDAERRNPVINWDEFSGNFN